jgi:3-oxoacyl-(acyl-carrier-protein) synthase
MPTAIAIVGLGCLLPQGAGNAALDRVLEGHCAAERWPENPRYIVGRVPDEPGPPGEGEDRAVAFALRVAGRALEDAGLLETRGGPGSRPAGLSSRLSPERCGCVFALSKGGVLRLVELARRARPAAAAPGAPGRRRAAEQGPWILSIDPAAGARAIAGRYALGGPVFAPVTACASGGAALARGRALILGGQADLVICGAADASLHELVLASYDRLGVLAPADGEPRRACRPFAADRRGFYIAEGAAAMVLASAPLAARLGLPLRALLAASAEGAFAHDLITVPSDGQDLARLIHLALQRAGVSAQDVDLVGAHGTATRDGDLNETRALHLALGRRADRVPVMATKPLHGHLLGAACAVESALVVRALETGRLAPTINLERRDPQCDLNYLADGPRSGEVRTAVKLAAGFGGQVSVNVFLRP